MMPNTIDLTSDIFSDSVVIDADVRSGVPVLRGTRVPLSLIVSEIADGGNIMEISEDVDIDVATVRRFFDDLSVALDHSFTEDE